MEKTHPQFITDFINNLVGQAENKLTKNLIVKSPKLIKTPSKQLNLFEIPCYQQYEADICGFYAIHNLISFSSTLLKEELIKYPFVKVKLDKSDLLVASGG